MSIFSRLYSGVLDTVYGFKLNRIRSQLEGREREMRQLIVRKVDADNKVDKTQVRNILIIKNESVTDMIMTTPLIRSLAVNGFKVDVLASESNQVVLECNPYVHRLVVLTGGAQQFVQEQMKDWHYDMVLDLRNPVDDEHLERLLFPQYISCDYLIGWNRSNIGIYDESLEVYGESGYFIDVVKAFLKYLEIDVSDFSCDVPVSMEKKAHGLGYMRNLWRKGGPVVVLHPFATQSSHNLSEFQVASLIDKILECYPFGQIILTGKPDQLSAIQVSALQEGHVHKFISPAVMDIVPLLEYADIVISPELMIMHMASAFQKPVLGLSTSMTGVALKSKEKAQQGYERQKQLLMAQFFDAPKNKNLSQPEAGVFNAHAFMPVNDKLEMVFSNTADMTYLSIESVVSVFQRLATQYVHDAQYVSPMKALSYRQTREEKQKDDAQEGEDRQSVSQPDQVQTAEQNVSEKGDVSKEKD